MPNETDDTAPAPLLTEEEAAKDLNCSRSFLAKSRMRGTGPAYIQLGRAVRYSRSALQAYKAHRTRTSTSHLASRCSTLKARARGLNVTQKVI